MYIYFSIDVLNMIYNIKLINSIFKEMHLLKRILTLRGSYLFYRKLELDVVFIYIY